MTWESSFRIFKSLRHFLIYSKMWISRTMSWISMINSGMILFLVLSKLRDYGIKIYITKWFFPIYFLVIILMILFGYLEDRLGFYREESLAHSKRNPYFDEILKKLDDINKRIGNIERNRNKK